MALCNFTDLAGFYFGYGWLNYLEDCSFKYNGNVGLHMYFGVNSINVIGGTFEGNKGAGIIVDTCVCMRVHALRVHAWSPTHVPRVACDTSRMGTCCCTGWARLHTAAQCTA